MYYLADHIPEALTPTSISYIFRTDSYAEHSPTEDEGTI